MTRAESATDPLAAATRSLQSPPTPLDVSTTTGQEPSWGAPERTDDPASLRHERFKIGDKLGEGGMGVVYRARDTRESCDVALKLMKGTLAGSARRRFEREFRSLATLRHPHCLRVFDYGEIGGGPFFTMELFVGRPITSLASRSLPEMLDALLQLTHALDYIHDHGIVHRDVKPSNILVRPTTRPDGSSHFDTRLMDFGLAKYYGVKTSLSAEAGFVGTVAYTAPEQINLDELDHRADLYCLGLVGYELLTGRYVFPEARLAGMRALIQAHLNDKPKPLSDINPDVPSPIAEAVMKYLRKQPRRRPDSAVALRSAITSYLGIDERSMVSGVSIIKSRPGLSVTGFVCRTKEQEAIAEVVLSCLRGACGPDIDPPPSLVVVSGEPGIGKSSVVQEAERIARGHGCQVYEGRCFDGNLSPFQPFVEIIRQLIAELRLQERREAAPADVDLTGTHVADLPSQSLVRMLAIVSDYSGELLRIAPELRKHIPGEAYRQVDYGSEADYIYRALSAFFLEIATLQPICLSFEDLQWADKSSLDLLRHLAAAVAEARRSASDGSSIAPRLVIVASARSGFDQLESLITQLRDRRQVLDIRLAPLVESETRELIALRLNCQPDELSPELVVRVHAICGGNPFFVAETVRDWFEKDAITRSESGWILTSQATDTSDLPETVRDVMRLRLQGLPAKVQQVVAASAVIGAFVEIDLLREVLPDISESDVLDAIDLLLPRRVFRETGNPGQVEFVHDLLRELPYADLSATRRQSLHRRVGERLESRREHGKSVAAAVLAEHFRNAEVNEKAFTYDLEAAQAAIDVYAFNAAIAHLDAAQKLMPNETQASTRHCLFNMLGFSYLCIGRPEESGFAYQRSLEEADNRIQKATAYRGLATVHEKRGEFQEAIGSYHSALSALGYPFPTSVLRMFFDLNKSFVWFHAWPSWFRMPDRSPDHVARLDLAFKSYYALTWVYLTRNLFIYNYCSYKAASLAKRSGRPDHLTIAYSKFGLNLGIFSFTGLADHYIRRAETAAALCDRKELHARVTAHFGMHAFFTGEFEEAEKDLSDSLELLDKVRDRIGVMSHHLLRHLYYYQGNIAKELAASEWEIAFGSASDNWETLCWGKYGKAAALARAGKLDEATELVDSAVEVARSHGTITFAIAAGTQGFVRLQASDYPGARASFEESRTIIHRTFNLLEFAALTYPGLVESLLGPYWASSERLPSRAVLRKAWNESRFARFVGWRYPNTRPYALRVSGRAAFALGKKKKAADFLQESIVAAQKLGARYDLARALLDASRVIPEKADEYRRRGLQLLDELGATVPEAERVL